MKLHEYIIDRLSRNMPCNLSLVAAGGSGKTYSMKNTLKKISEGNITYLGKRVVPIYIEANRYHLFTAESDSDNYIKDQLLSMCGPINIDSIYTVLRNNVLNIKNSAYHFLLLIDGLNETRYQSRITNELKELKNCQNLSFVISSRSNNNEVSDLVDETVELQEIDLETVSKLVGTKSQSLLNLLRRPFYLSKYLEMDEASRSKVGNAFSLLQSYLDWTISKFIDYDDLVEDIFYEGVIKECFLMSSKGEMFFSEKNITNIRTGLKKLDINITERKIKKILCDSGYFKQVELKTKEGKTIRLLQIHELDRNFFCSLFITQCINRNLVISEPKNNANLRMPAEALELTANGLLNIDRFFDGKGNILFDEEEFFKLFFYSGMMSTESKRAAILNYCFLTYNMLEAHKNGTSEKSRFCNSYLNLSRRFYDKMMNLQEELEYSDVPIYNSIIQHTEILRRAKHYDEAISVIGECLKYVDKNTQHMVYCDLSNGRVKNKLLSVYDRAVQSNEVVPEVLSDLSEAINELEKLVYKEKHETSSNLYCLMLSNPDMHLKKYTDELWKDMSLTQRRVKAAETNWEIAKEKIKCFDDSSLFYYPLEQVCSALVNGTVSPSEDSFTSFNEMLDSETLTFAEPTSDRTSAYKAVKCISDFILDYRNKKDAVIFMLNAKMDLMSGGPYEKIMEALNNSKSILLSKFMFSAFSCDNNVKTIEKVITSLKDKADNRTPDSFDAVYVKEDISRMWSIILKRNSTDRYTKEYLDKIDEMLNLKLY